MKRPIQWPRKRAWGRTLKQVALALCLALVLGIAQAMTLSQAINKVRRDTGGKILSAQTVVQDSREVHVIKVLTQDKRVRTVRVAGDPVKPRKRPPN